MSISIYAIKTMLDFLDHILIIIFIILKLCE